MKETNKLSVEGLFEIFDKEWLKTVHQAGAKNYGLDCFKAGYAASQATVGQQVRQKEFVMKKFGIERELYLYNKIDDMDYNDLIHLLSEFNSLTSPATVAPPVIGGEIEKVFEKYIHYWQNNDGEKFIATRDSEQLDLKIAIIKAMEEYANKFQPPVSGKEVVSKRDFVSWFYNQKPYFPTPHQCYDWFIQNNKTLTNDI